MPNPAGASASTSTSAVTSFPWGAVAPKIEGGISDRREMVARVVKMSIGDATTVVCESFYGGNGDVTGQLVVLGNKIKLSNGNVSILFCLRTAEIEYGNGNVGEVKYLSNEELVKKALELTGLQPEASHPVW